MDAHEANCVMKNAVEDAAIPLDLQTAKPTRFPGRTSYRRHGTNYGLTNPEGAWMFEGENIACFKNRADAHAWIADPNRYHGELRNWRILPADTEFGR